MAAQGNSMERRNNGFQVSQTKTDLVQTFAISMGDSIVNYPQKTAVVTCAFTTPFERRKAALHCTITTLRTSGSLSGRESLFFKWERTFFG